MRYIEAPENYEGDDASIFLAGGIRGCPDWQSELSDSLRNENVVLLNPRRKVFPVDNPNAVEEQIMWEHDHLWKAKTIVFWFPKESVDTMTLYELGAWSMTEKPIFVGVHPEYSRRLDVEIQTRLERPDVRIVNDLQSLSNQIKEWMKR